MEFQPVQLVEETKQYEFKPYVEKGLNPYKVYYLVKDTEVYKMASIDFSNTFTIIPLLSYSTVCKSIKGSTPIKELLQEYDTIYTVPSEYDGDHQQEYNNAFKELTKWIYSCLIPSLLDKRYGD